jgi:SAM-dependent methyltransferase
MSRPLLVFLFLVPLSFAPASETHARFGWFKGRKRPQRKTVNKKTLQRKAFAFIKATENSYTRGRGLGNYGTALGEAFVAKMKELGKKANAHWLDAGGGDGKAVHDFISWNGSGQTQTTLLSYQTAATKKPRLDVMVGRFIENIPASELPQSDVITDVYGPFAYTTRPDLVLHKYLSRLKPDGVIFMSLGSDYGVFGRDDKVATASGKVLTLEQWLSTLRGVNVKMHKRQAQADMHEGHIWSVEITKTPGETPRIPELEILHYKPGMPPIRLFAEKNVLPHARKTRLALAEQDKRRQLLEQHGKQDARALFQKFRTPMLRRKQLKSSVGRLKQGEKWTNIGPFSPKKLQGKPIVREGRLFEPKGSNAPPSTSGQTRVISDAFGEMMATTRPDLVLESYLDQLSKNGELYLMLGKTLDGYGENATVLTKNGKRKSLRQWLKSIKGLKVQDVYDVEKNGLNYLRIRVKNRKKIAIPALETLGSGMENKDGIAAPLLRER